MSETSSGGSVPSSLLQCKYCSTPLPAINTPFCGQCGAPQMEMKHCIRCQTELPVSNKFCFQCRQDQTQPLPRKPCLLCGTLLPANAQNCPFCSAPQDPQVMLSVQLKYCHNQNCQTALMYGLTVCYKCRSQQPMPPLMHLLIKAEPPNPQMMPPHYPQLFPPATPLPMTPGMQSQGGQPIGHMCSFPIHQHPTMTDPRLSGQQMHQPLPSPQPLMSLPTQPDIYYAAINILKGVCCSVLDGTVTSDLLKKLKGKKEQVQKLCEAITVESHGESENTLSPDHFTYEDINTALDERLKEYNYFLEYHQKLKHICNHLDGLSIQGN